MSILKTVFRPDGLLSVSPIPAIQSGLIINPGGRGVRRTITTQGGVGGGCSGKHYWLMEL